jgi:hypothetical protein
MLTSANFRFRKGERGLSVYRARCRSADEVLKAAGPGSTQFFLVSATVGGIRRSPTSTGRRFDVVPDDGDGKNPGHAESRRPEPGPITKAEAYALRELFAESLNQPI